MAKDIQAEILAASEFTVKAAQKEINKTLDYSISSLRDVESLIFRVQQHFFNLKKDGKPTEQTAQKASVSIGAYLGEVIRREYAGHWVEKPGTMKAVVIRGQEFLPMTYVFQRLTQGLDVSVETYVADVNAKIKPQVKLEETPVSALTPNRENSQKDVVTWLVLGVAAVAVVVILGGGFGWFYLNGPCGTRVVKKTSEQLLEVTEKFSDAYEIANSSPRISLAGPIGELQEVQRSARQIEVPSCLADTHNWLILGMESYTDGFISFLGQDSDATINLHFATGDLYISAATNELDRITECAPFCKPASEVVAP